MLALDGSEDYISSNNGLMSFATASKAASDFITHLYSPVFARIDPEEVGARSRSMRIATEYGKRLAIKSQTLRPTTLRALSETYPSHSFVIDRTEAATLFQHVRDVNEAEQKLVLALGKHARYEGAEFIFQALSEPNRVGAQNDAKANRGRSSSANGRNPARADGKTVVPSKRAGRSGAKSVQKQSVERSTAQANGRA